MSLLCSCFCDIHFVPNPNKTMRMIMCICIYCNLKKLGERRDEKNNTSIKQFSSFTFSMTNIFYKKYILY